MLYNLQYISPLWEMDRHSLQAGVWVWQKVTNRSNVVLTRANLTQMFHWSKMLKTVGFYDSIFSSNYFSLLPEAREAYKLAPVDTEVI